MYLKMVIVITLVLLMTTPVTLGYFHYNQSLKPFLLLSNLNHMLNFNMLPLLNNLNRIGGVNFDPSPNFLPPMASSTT